MAEKSTTLLNHNLSNAENDISSIDYDDFASIIQALGAGLGPERLPWTEMLSAENVRRQSQETSSQIFNDWDLLRGIVERHELTIQKRWIKKTRGSRTKILLAAWPKMSTHHRPDYAAFRRETHREREAGTKFRDAFLWPYINLEDLSKPKTLPMFLNARARNPPCAFTMADKNAIRLGYATNVVVPGFLPGYTMMFTNRKNPRAYGELISWDQDQDAFEWLISGKGIHPGQGVIILEVQQRTLSFLLDCCRMILHDVPLEKLLSDEYPILKSPSVSGDTQDGYASLAILTAEAPYRAPTTLDLARLESLFAAKKAAAEDHLWALREDPAYFAYTLMEIKEHRLELVKDRRGRVHPMAEGHGEEFFWERIIGTVLSDTNSELEVWSELHTQIEKLESLQAKYADDISPEEDLPAQYLDAILRFQHYLIYASKMLLDQLKHDACASAPLRSRFLRGHSPDLKSTEIVVRRNASLNLSFAEDQLIWLLEVLGEDKDDLFEAGLTNIVDELQRLIQVEAKAKELISAHVSDIIGSLALISEALRQVGSYSPWAQTFESALVRKQGDILKESLPKSRKWDHLRHTTDGEEQGNITRLGIPTQARFRYPVDKRRTKGNVEAMRAAEANLDTFWSTVDDNTEKQFGNDLDGTAWKKLFARSRAVRRTPPWVDPTNGAKEQKTKEDVASASISLSELELRTECTIERSPGNKVPTAKKKTRRAMISPDQNDAQAASPPSNSSLPEEQPIFEVDARALRVFHTLFFIPSQHCMPGEIPWTDFLHAMASIGFTPEKLGGSMWQFQPKNVDVKRSIQFHEPHPGGKLPYLKARFFGGRLERAYGWRGETFVLREKRPSHSSDEYG